MLWVYRYTGSPLVILDRTHEFVLRVYEISRSFPKEETFGLALQIRSAAVAISRNIVDGKARTTTNEYNKCLLIAIGCLEEVKYQLLLARDLHYIDDMTYEEVLELAKEVGTLINAVIRRLGITVIRGDE